MKVAIVHDDLVQWGGAERVLEAICQIYPDAPIYTSVFDRDNKQLVKRFGHKKIVTSFLQKIPFWRFFYKAMLPLYPIAFEQFDFTDFDLVISHTTRFAKGIITKPETKHICYCHTPPRFLWHFSGEKAYGSLEIVLSKLRIYDTVSSNRVDHFLAGSENAKRRIKKIYKMESKVVYPFVDLDRFKDIESFEGDYFVSIARLNKYKRVDLAISACLEAGLPLKVIGTGSELSNLKKLCQNHKNAHLIEFLGNVNDEMVSLILSGCKALIVCGVEDFGITPLEAQALGKPVVAYRSGGVLETVKEDKTGIFFDSQRKEDLLIALQSLNIKKLKMIDCKQNASNFSKDRFIQSFKESIANL